MTQVKQHLLSCSYSIFGLGNMSKCRQYGEKVLTVDPRDPLGFNILANSYIVVDKPYDYAENKSCQDAVRIAREGLQKNPDHPGLMLTLVRAHITLGSFYEAMLMAEHALAVAPQLEAAMLYASQSALALNEYEKAERYASKLKDHDGLSGMANDVIREVKMSKIADSLISSSLQIIHSDAAHKLSPYEQIIR